MPDRVLELLDEEIKKAQDHVDRLIAVRDALEKDAALRAILTGAVITPKANGPIAPPDQQPEVGRRGHRAPELAKIVEYLKGHPMEWIAVSQIERATKIRKSLINVLIDKHHGEIFTSTQPSRMRKYYALKESAPPPMASDSPTL